VSVLVQKQTYALVSTNSLEAARTSHIYAVIQLCYGSDDNALAVTYSRLDERRMGYQMPCASIVIGKDIVKLPVLSGELWTDAVRLAEAAILRIKQQHGRVPAGRQFKVFRDGRGQTVVEELVHAHV
jgi:hypothetical protein